MAKAILKDPVGPPVEPPKVLPSWDILFDVRQPDVEHPNGHYVIHKPTGHQWEKGDLDRQVFSIVRCQCEEKDLPVFQSWQKVLREQYLYDIPTEKIGKIDTVPVEVIRVKVADGKETRGWFKDVPQIRKDGSFAGFREEWRELVPGKYSLRLTYQEVDEQKENFRIDQSIFTPTLLMEKNIYDVDRGTMGACLVATSTAEKRETQKLLDTRQNAILTVGTGKTYSTISAAITASASGDIIEVYATTANTYTENIDYGTKSLTVLSPYSVGYRAITITKSSGVIVTIGAATCRNSILANFVIVATGTATICVNGNNVSSVQVNDVEAVGGSTGCFYYPGQSSIFRNCLARDSAGYGWIANISPNIFINCLAVDNGTYGWSNTTNVAHYLYECLAVGNGTNDYQDLTTSFHLNCVSGDTSATGLNDATGFLTTDFVDYAGNDFRIKPSVAATTKARFLGYPLTHDDAFGNERKTTGVVFAGWSDPDPVVDVYPAVGHTRAPDVYGPGGTGYVGTETLPDVSLVNSGTQYGAGGTEFTGTLAFTIPTAPTWNGLPTSGNGQVTLPVVPAMETDVVYAVYKPVLTGSWSAQSETFKRTGSGNIVVTGLANGTAYWFAIYSKRSGAYSAWAGALPCTPGDPALVTSYLKNLKTMIITRVQTLLTAYSITCYDNQTPASAHGSHAVIKIMAAPAVGQRYHSGYTVDLTITLYTRPDASNDNIDDMIDALVTGLHAHSEFSDTYGWHWQSTQFLLRNSDIVMDSKTRCGIVEFQLSAKEI